MRPQHRVSSDRREGKWEGIKGKSMDREDAGHGMGGVKTCLGGTIGTGADPMSEADSTKGMTVQG